MKKTIGILILAGLIFSSTASAIDNGTENSNGQTTEANTEQNMANAERKVEVNMEMIQRFNDYQIDGEYVTLWDVLNGTNMEEVREIVEAYNTYYNERTIISNNLASSPY